MVRRLRQKRSLRKGGFTLPGRQPSHVVLRSKVVLFGLGVALIWIGVFFGREWSRRSRVESEILRIQQEIAHIESSGWQLEQTLQMFARSEIVEQEARRRLNVARPGETVVVIPRYDEGTSLEEVALAVNSVSVVMRSGTGPLANIVAWWQYFFDQAIIDDETL